MIIEIHGEITKDTAKTVSDQLKMSNGEPIELHIDSIGGDLFAGLSIYNQLQAHEVAVFVDGTAGSIASVIALAGKKPPAIASTGSITIHNAHADNIKGNQHDVQKVANSLAKYSEIVANVYEAKTKLKTDDIIQLMNDETTFSALDAVAVGFASDVYNKVKVLAKINPNNINMNLLEKIKNSLNVEGEVTEETTTEETTTEETPSGEAFTPEQVEAIRTLIMEILSEEMTAKTEELETTVGNTVATVLNSIVSKEIAPTSAKPSIATPTEQSNGVTSFYKKMNEIKNKTEK